MTAQEGAFWLRAGLLDQITRPVAAAERALAEGELSADDAYELAVHTQLPYGEAMSALVAVLDPAEIAARLAGPPPPKPSWSPYGRDMGHFTAGVRLHLVPRLADADRERLAEAAAAALRSDLSRPDKLFAASAVLAAQLGCSEEVAEFVSRWPDGWFGQGGGGGYETIAIGLGSREAFWAETRRTTMSPAMAHSVPGWLAQSELDDLAGFERALSAREGRMAVLFAAFAARVHAPEAAPMMVRSCARGCPSSRWNGSTRIPRPRPRGSDAPPTRRDAAPARARAEPLRSLPVRALGLPRPKRAPSAAGLPPLVVDGARLAQEDVEAVLAALAKDEPLPVELDPEAAEEFAWELFERWMFEGGPPKEKWRMLALGRLGRDGSAMRLAPLIRAWPGESQHKRAVLGLDVLRAIGTDTALMQLNGIAQKLKYKALQERARMAIEEIAEELGLTREELEDRIVPDCGLDADGSRTFDYGPRTFAFVLGSDMKPKVRDEAGQVRASPPKPGVRDTTGAAAVAEWKLVRKQVGEVAKLQAARLEQAMIARRRWAPEDFEAYVVGHPLMRLLARRLLWTSGNVTFRVTEEGDYADSRDEPVAVLEPVRLAHPLELGEAERAAWGELVGDYELVPPFPQLGRPLYDVSVGPERFVGRQVESMRLMSGLERAGWARGEVEDGGVYRSHELEYAGGRLTVEYGEGIIIGDPTYLGDQTVGAVQARRPAVGGAGARLALRDPRDARRARPGLASVVGGPRLPDDGDLDLARVLELLLDLAGDLVAEQDGAVVVERARHDHDADLAAGLHGVDLVDAVVAGGDLLEVAQALDVLLERLAAGARAGAGERVGGLDDHGLDGLRLDLVVVGLHRVRDGLGLAVAAGQVAADERVRALDLVADGLADVVQQRGAAGGLGRRAELLGHHRGQVGALDRVREHVLAVARAVLEAAEDADQLGVQALDVGVQRGLLAGLDDVGLELGLGLVVGLLDPGRVDAAVGEQLLQRHAGDLAADAVEAGQDHGVRRVVDDEVDAGEVLEGADVAALAADDAALHVVGGQLDDATRSSRPRGRRRGAA